MRSAVPNDYFRRDQDDGVTAPDLSKMSSYAEHIVRARGKRTQFTSVSLDPARIRDFGPTLYRLQKSVVQNDQHHMVEHDALLASLRKTIESADKAERARALQAMRYATTRVEGLVRWNFQASAVEPKNLVTWAFKNVQKYFSKA